MVEEEGVWMRNEGHQEEGHVFLRRGLPSLRELTGSLQGELALGTCDWRELAISAAGVFVLEMEVGVRGRCMCRRGKAGDRSEM